MEKQVEFKVGSETLRGKLFVPESKGPFPGVIFFHGSGGKGETYFKWASKLVNEGIATFAFNFRGCGISDGDYLTQTLEDAFQDGKAAVNFFLTQNIDPDRLGMLGGSFGGYVAAMILPQMNVKSLALKAPSAHGGDPTNTKINMGNLEDEVNYFKNRNNWENSLSFQNVMAYKGSLLVVKLGNDENVPPEVVDQYFEKATNVSKKEIKIINDADHRLTVPGTENQAYEIFSRWFKETL